MIDPSTPDHKDIVESLPDFALGKFDGARLQRVAFHLESSCPTCRTGVATALDVGGSLAAVPPPPARVRRVLLRRVAAGEEAARSSSAMAAGGPTVDWDWDMADYSGRAHHRAALPVGRPFLRRMLEAASAAARLIALLAGGSRQLRNGAIQEDRISALVNDPAAAHPLDDSELSDRTTGVAFIDPAGHDVELVAPGLPALPSDQRYRTRRSKDSPSAAIRPQAPLAAGSGRAMRSEST